MGLGALPPPLALALIPTSYTPWLSIEEEAKMLISSFSLDGIWLCTSPIAAWVLFLKYKSEIVAPLPPTLQGCLVAHGIKHKLTACFSCKSLCELAWPTWPASALTTYFPTPRWGLCSNHINTSKPLTIPQPNKLSLMPPLFPLPEVPFTALSTWQICTHYLISSSNVVSLGKFLWLPQSASNLFLWSL